MVLRLISFRSRRPRPRALSRARSLGLTPCSAIESLEERTLLSASLALYNGSFAGTYKGTETVNDNGHITHTTDSPTAFQMTISNGAIAVTTPSGPGTGTVNSNGSISGSVIVQISGQTVPVAFSGSVTTANNSTTNISGSWSYSADLGGGVTVSGHGTWLGSAQPVLTNFDGNYVGTYQGTETVNNHGTKTTSTVDPTAFQAVINNGTITDIFASNSGLSNGTGTTDVHGSVHGTVAYLTNGITVTVTDSGHLTRSRSGVNGSGTWSYTANFGGGVVETGKGTWTVQSVLVVDGSFTGNFNGSTVVNDNGTITTTAIPDEVSDLSLSLTISNGSVILAAPGVPATGTGTIDQAGHIIGSSSFEIEGVPVVGQFIGTAVATPFGNVITGTWTFAIDFGGGISETGTGTWTAESTPIV